MYNVLMKILMSFLRTCLISVRKRKMTTVYKNDTCLFIVFVYNR